MASVVHQEQVQAVGERIGEAPEVLALRVAVSLVGFPEVALSGGGFDGSIDVEALEL